MQNIVKKIIPYLLILIALVGLFGLAEKANAQTSTDPNRPGICSVQGTRGTFDGSVFNRNFYNIIRERCVYEQIVVMDSSVQKEDNYVWTPGNSLTPAGGEAASAAANQSQFVAAIDELACGFDGIMPGCLIKGFYYLLYVLPAYLLTQAAYFFNVLISVTLNGTVFKQDFVPTAWGVVRDLSNIFFILILLYIAVKIILDMGGHEAKQTIAKVVVIALLINFSMFFTQVIIDASNVLALVFYNKVSVTTKVAGQTGERPYASVGGEKDVAGGMVAAFDPTTTLKQDFFTEVKKNYGPSGEQLPPSSTVPWGTLLALILIAGLIMCFAIYALMVTGLSFLGRLIELWVLIIFSPFAFMSSTVPLLSGVEYLGWGSWFKRLLKVSFMAPIFMFFLYFIFMLIDSNVFNTLVPRSAGESTPATVVKMILGVVMPTLLILVLLLKATEIAKKSSGMFGEGVMTATKILGGLAVGGVALGAAAAGRATVGATAKYVQNDGARKKDLRFSDARSAMSEIRGLNIINPLKYAKVASKVVSGAPKAATAGVAEILHKAGLGKRLKEADEGYGHKTHAMHILDAKMQSEFGHQYGKDAKYKDLTEHEQEIVRGEIEKDEMAKYKYGKLFKDLEALQAQDIQTEFKNGQRAIDNGHGTTLRIDDKNNVNTTAGEKLKSNYFADIAKTNTALGEFAQALRKGSYDIRSLPDMSAKTKGFPKFGVALVSGIAAGVRLGLKKGGGVEYGTPQRDVFKDIGNTITEALKNVKINVSAGGGHGGGHDEGHAKEVKSVGH